MRKRATKERGRMFNNIGKQDRDETTQNTDQQGSVAGGSVSGHSHSPKHRSMDRMAVDSISWASEAATRPVSGQHNHTIHKRITPEALPGVSTTPIQSPKDTGANTASHIAAESPRMAEACRVPYSSSCRTAGNVKDGVTQPHTALTPPRELKNTCASTQFSNAMPHSNINGSSKRLLSMIFRIAGVVNNRISGNNTRYLS
jgi:hypothetical protein